MLVIADDSLVGKTEALLKRWPFYFVEERAQADSTRRAIADKLHRELGEHAEAVLLRLMLGEPAGGSIPLRAAAVYVELGLSATRLEGLLGSRRLGLGTRVNIFWALSEIEAPTSRWHLDRSAAQSTVTLKLGDGRQRFVCALAKDLLSRDAVTHADVARALAAALGRLQDEARAGSPSAAPFLRDRTIAAAGSWLVSHGYLLSP